MRRLDKVLVLERRHTSLSSLSVHVLQLCSPILLHMAFDHLNDLFVVCQIRTVALQTNHIQCRRSFQRAVNVEELARVLGAIKVRRHTAVPIRLRSQKIRVYTDQL